MEDCNVIIASIIEASAGTTPISSRPFRDNDSNAIVKELNGFCRLIDRYIDMSFSDITSAVAVFEEAANAFGLFFLVLEAYMNRGECQRGASRFADVLRRYLCRPGRDRFNMTIDVLYHLMTNYALLAINCAKLSLKNPQQLGDALDTILRSPFNTAWQFSKSGVKKCIDEIPDDYSNTRLILARRLLGQSVMSRERISVYCPDSIAKRGGSSEHDHFITQLREIWSMVDTKIARLYR